ncbi:MAG: PAS domain-containing protein [Gemmatimonadaceae bacterium]|nr:PAS domain-containing protein [Gemmatimonadaceae bacterium]
MSHPISVLLVHTADERRAALVNVLREGGYHVLGPCPSAEEALDLCAHVHPDLALVQPDLPGSMSTEHLARQLRRLGGVATVFLVDDDYPAPNTLVDALPAALLPATVTDATLLATLDLARRHAHALQLASDPDARFFAVTLDLLCFLDFSGYFRRLSPAWERTLGWSLGELLARPFIDFVHPDDRERTLNQNRAVRGGGQALGFENRYRCKDGSYRWFRWNAAADVDQGVIYSVARDITDAKVAESEREELIADLQRALAEVKTLREIIPICSYCRKVRDDDDFWQHVEAYIVTHTGSQFSHGVCPTCYDRINVNDVPS